MSAPDTLIDRLQRLRDTKQEHFDLGMRLMRAADGALFPLDLLVIAVLNRSLWMTIGFCDLVERKNLLAAVPLLRLQLDSAFRFHAAYLVANVDEFVEAVLRGTSIRRQKDRDGREMTDRYLAERLSVAESAPWVIEAYEATSGYVHLSEEHVRNALQSPPAAGGAWTVAVGDQERFAKTETYDKPVQIFSVVTALLLRKVERYVRMKEAIPAPAAVR